MKTSKHLYFLPIAEAEEIAAKHTNEEDWDIWDDKEAYDLGILYSCAARSRAPLSAKSAGDTRDAEMTTGKAR